MTDQVRPRPLASIFDQAFRLYCDQLPLFCGIAALIFIPGGFLMSLGHLTHVEVRSLVEQTYRAGIPIVQMAATFAVASIYLKRSVTITDCYEPILPLLLRVGLTELLLLISVIIAFLLLVVPGFYVLVAWSFVPQVMMMEGLWGRDALKRSEQLIKGVWWRTWGLQLIVLILSESSAGYSLTWWKFAPIVGPLMTAIILSVVWGYASAVLAVYYFDRRFQVERFDLGGLSAALKVASASAQDRFGFPSAVPERN
jgi:hypothetical protein